LHCVVILHAPIGGGKTRTAESVAERAKADGIRVMGILSKRIIGDGLDPSYDLVELDTGETMPLVKPAGIGVAEGWESFDNPRFVFSRRGLDSANLALHRAAEELRDGVVVFVDEWGRLESQKKGIHSGAVMVANALSKGGVAIYLCREDKVNEVKELVNGKASRVFQLEAGDTDALLRIILGCARL
jgi:nucleoside-triphosphatase THEP1